MYKIKTKMLYLLASTLFFSCSKENPNNGLIWDVRPLNICIYVQNQDGKDLLDASTSDFIKNDIKVVYKDKSFPIELGVNERSTLRAYLAVLRGLQLRKYGNEYYLNFGEFNGATDWNDSFEIYWGDGTKDEIRFQHDFEWAADGSPKFVSSALYLNGKKVDKKLIIKKNVQIK